MSQDISLEEIIKRIVNQSGASREEILKHIEDSIANTNGLLTKVGAAFILAEKLKVHIDMDLIDPSSGAEPSIINIGDIAEGMRNINVIGRIIEMRGTRTFQKSDGRKGRVGSLVIRDATGKVRVTLWDQKASLAESSLNPGEIIGIYNAYVKRGYQDALELNVGNKGGIKPKPPGVVDSDYPSINLQTCKVGDIAESMEVCSIVGEVVQKFPVKEFTKKDGMTGKVGRIRVGDETGITSVVFWTNRIDTYDKISEKDVIEINNASVRMNNYRKEIELHVNPGTRIKKSSKSVTAIATASTPGGVQGTGVKQLVEDFSEIAEQQFNLTVRGQVVSKSDVRTWDKGGDNKGSVANVYLRDKNLN
ncbi:MAG: OB-fold nucleic acid binding domain-containing protein, partial [Promethearchaeota archaeon]